MKKIITLLVLVGRLAMGGESEHKQLDQYVKNFDLTEVKNMKISSVEMLNMIEEGSAVLIDIRFKEEVQSWSIPFAKNIPLNELPERLNELPKDKLIITACPHNDRANIARLYLTMKGYKAKYVNDGLLNVVNYLKGSNAVEFIEELNKNKK
ncbi:MAG: rhodanese-like domain-containing protein [Campylobacterales bacterium]|nr:rhodanese-like domain-containing protein [Campylobacterales bacterium]